MCWCFWPSSGEVYKKDEWPYDFQMNFDYTLVVEAMNIWSQKRNITILSDFVLKTQNMSAGNHVNVVTGHL